MNQPLVSVIVATKNAEKFIKNSLESVKKQTYRTIEIIVVDNYSTDHTIMIAKKYTDDVYKYGLERSSQRNFGVKKSNGKYLLFLDADMQLSPKVIERCVAMNNKSNIGGIYIPEIIKGKNYWSKVRNFERQFYNGTVIDAVRFLPKEVFKNIGGFDENLYAGEDWDLDRRVRKIGKTATVNVPLYHDENDFSLKKYLQKKSYYSLGIQTYRQKWKNDPDTQKQLGFWYRYFLVFIENEKWKRLIKHPFLTCGMMFLKICIGILYLYNKSNEKNRPQKNF